MQQLLVALDWPAVDFGAVAVVLAPLLNDHPTDIAARVRRSRGFVEVPLDAAAAEVAATALRAANHRFCAVAADWMPRLPKPRTTRCLDTSQATALTAQIALTGPPESLPWARVLAAVPTLWLSSVAGGPAGPAPKGRSLTSKAMSLATTGGIGMLLSKGTPKGSSQASSVSVARPMLVIVGHGGIDVGHVRYHLFADAADYRVLPAPTQTVATNWAALLGTLVAQLRPDLAFAAELAAGAAGVDASGDLVIDDDNLLERTLRHRMMCAALMRMGW